MTIERIICDSSIIIDGKVTQMVVKGELKDVEIIIPLAVLDELQAQASKGKEPGFIGLDELKRLREICEEKKIPLVEIEKLNEVTDILKVVFQLPS